VHLVLQVGSRKWFVEQRRASIDERHRSAYLVIRRGTLSELGPRNSGTYESCDGSQHVNKARVKLQPCDQSRNVNEELQAIHSRG
jgi:hypothetical protein